MKIVGVMARTLLRTDQVRYEGITDSVRRSIIACGAVPLVILPTQNINYIDTKGSDIPPLTEEEKNQMIEVIKKCDGVILPGGNRTYAYDYFVSQYLIDNDIPTLGICMGMQSLGNTDNKTYFADGTELNDTNINHCQKEEDYVHDVIIDKNSILYEIIGKDRIKVNSMHKYHLLKTNKFKVTAKSPDGIIEAIEYPGKKFMMGLQWHPEKMIEYDNTQEKIIKYFISKL